MPASHPAPHPSDLNQAHARIAALEQELARTRASSALLFNHTAGIVNQLQDGIVLLSESNHILLINEAFCQLWSLPQPAAYWVGQAAESLIATISALVAAPDDYPQRMETLRRCNKPVYNEMIQLHNGRLLLRDFLPVQETPDAPRYLLVCVRDVTDYHRVTSQLRSVASIPAQNPNPILRISPDREVRYTNLSANGLLASLTEPDRAQLLDQLSQTVMVCFNRNQPQQVDVTVSSYHFAAFVVPVMEDGFASVYMTNVTARVRMQLELVRARDAAEGAVKAREHFLANMSHEIRTPMNGVLGMAAQLGKTRLDTRQQELLGVIRSSGQHLLSIINDVLDMAKITSGQLDLEQTAFNLCDSFAQALVPLIHQASEKGLVVAGTPLRNSCSYPWVLGDPYRLNQILINLVSNAIKFTPAGGRIIVIARQLASTDTTLTVAVSVEDSGIGIPPEQQARIFEGFTQAYADTTRRFGGTGLGLSISRALVQQHGGTLQVQSEVGRGSVFSFELTLPRAQQPATIMAEPVALDTGSLRGRRALLFEDNEINRDVARLLLEEWGVHVDEAENAYLGLELFAKNEYDVLLMDIQMPGMSGLEATAIIRQLPNPHKANIPILALTANAFRADNERYLAAGMNACLTKPFDEAHLYQQLELLMGPAEPAPAYDLTRLTAMAHGRTAFITKIIRSFLTNIPDSLAQLEAAAAQGNWPEVACVVHNIKPSLEALGIAAVAEALDLLQQPDSTPEAAGSRHAAMAHLTAQLRRALHQLPRELPAA